MAYTATDLENVVTAIRALMNGTRTVRLTMGDKSIEYAAADLKALLSFYDEQGCDHQLLLSLLPLKVGRSCRTA